MSQFRSNRAMRRGFGAIRHSIPFKANQVLYLIMMAMVLILFRVWHLSVVQHDKKAQEALRATKRTVWVPANRGTIRDRFNRPLAINRLKYDVAVIYSDIQQLPYIQWVADQSGKKSKVYYRRNYIEKLSRCLERELKIDRERVEDEIYAKAALYHNVPFVIKKGISEQEYYRLKALESDYPGLCLMKSSKRFYPNGKVAGSIVGYIGAINREEYERVMGEIRLLEQFVKECELGICPSLPYGNDSIKDAYARLDLLKGKAYSINDTFGKGGIELKFEEILRGSQGEKRFYADARGRFLHTLPGGTEAVPGKRVLLSISLELQEFAENLLIQNEKIREGRSVQFDRKKGIYQPLKQPWIKGGAIVAMDPKTGEVIALATHPRHDPNDFVFDGEEEEVKERKREVLKWFETEGFIGEIWDQQRPIERERVEDGEVVVERKVLDWKSYLSEILPKESEITDALSKVEGIGKVISFLQNFQALLDWSGEESGYPLMNVLYPEGIVENSRFISEEKEEKIRQLFMEIRGDVEEVRGKIDPILYPLSNNYNRVLLIDLCKAAIAPERFSDQLKEQVSDQSISLYRTSSSSFFKVDQAVEEMARELFHREHFSRWRKEHQKAFLKEKRALEVERKTYARPYLDYLDREERAQFKQFWEEHRYPLVIALLKGVGQEEDDPYLKLMGSWEREISQGAHIALPWRESYLQLKGEVVHLSDHLLQSYLKSFRRFSELTTPLYGSYRYLRKEKGVQLEKHLARAFYPIYGYGLMRSYAYQQAVPQGSVFKLVTGYTALMQKWKESDGGGKPSSFINPLTIEDRPFNFKGKSYLGRFDDGTPIPILYKKGRLLRSMSRSIGTIDIRGAIKTSSNPYFSILAGDVINDPADLLDAARQFSYGERTGIDLPGEFRGKLPTDISHNRSGLYTFAVGQHSMVVTPLQTAVMLSTLVNGGAVLKPQIVKMSVSGESGLNSPVIESFDLEEKRKVEVPVEVKEMLSEGMGQVVDHFFVDGGASLARRFTSAREAMTALRSLRFDLIGKTGTAETIENVGLDLYQGTNKYNNSWFGGICFEKIKKEKGGELYLLRDQKGEPELVVAAYLRFGGYGKEAAPVVAQVMKRWREINGSGGG